MTEHFVLSARTNIPDGTPGSIVVEDKDGILIDTTEDEAEVIVESDTEDKEDLIVETEISPKAFISASFQSFHPDKIPTFMDSGASDTMFVSRDAFIEYKTIPLRTGDSAKATDGSFDIIGQGKVVQQYLVDGKEKRVTYTHALHTPTLNANLISVSAFDRAGLTTTFGDGRGIIRKRDGTAVLTGRGEKGMYVVDTINGETPSVPDKPIAMSSLS